MQSCSTQNSRKDFCLFTHLVGDQIGNSDKGIEKLFIDIDVPFILGEVSLAVSLVQHSPMLGSEVEGVLGALEYEITVLGPVARASQRCQRQSMRGVVSKVEPGFLAQALVLGIGQPDFT